MPEFRTKRLPSCQRGECGMTSPVLTGSPDATSSTAPLSLAIVRHPPGSSVAAITVTKAGDRSRIANPLR